MTHERQLYLNRDGGMKYGIQPVVTLFHGDMPLWVFDEGGWGYGQRFGLIYVDYRNQRRNFRSQQNT